MNGHLTTAQFVYFRTLINGITANTVAAESGLTLVAIIK